MEKKFVRRNTLVQEDQNSENIEDGQKHRGSVLSEKMKKNREEHARRLDVALNKRSANQKEILCEKRPDSAIVKETEEQSFPGGMRSVKMMDMNEKFEHGSLLKKSIQMFRTADRRRSLDESFTYRIVKGPWSKEEDKRLLDIVREFSPRNWTEIGRRMGTRLGKQCRERWHNHLHPSINKEPFSELENVIIYKLHTTMGNRWSEISKYLPGRTDNSIKNHWNSTLQRDTKMQRTLNTLSERNLASLIKRLHMRKDISKLEDLSRTAEMELNKREIPKKRAFSTFACPTDEKIFSPKYQNQEDQIFHKKINNIPEDTKTLNNLEKEISKFLSENMPN